MVTNNNITITPANTELSSSTNPITRRSSSSMMDQLENLRRPTSSLTTITTTSTQTIKQPEVQPGHVFEACGPVDVFEGDKIMLKECKP